MFENLSSYFSDPIIRNAAWSAITLLFVLLFEIFIRRFLNSLKIDDDRKQRARRWINSFALFLFVIVLIRIWAHTYLSRLFSPAVIEKIISTGFGFILTILIIYTVRRLIDTLKIDNARRRQYRQWSVYIFVFLYILILIRIWAYTNLFRFTENPIVSKLITSGIVLGIVYLALFFVRRYINSLKVEIEKRHQYRKRASYAAALIYILILVPIWAGSTQQWATVLSVMGAGIALALHEVLLNMAGWVYIVVRRPYKEGDRIELGGLRGDVIDIQLFQTTLLEIGNWVDGDQSTGRVVHLPHGQIFRNPLYNYTKGFEFLWHETSIIVTFESNWEKAGDILLKCGEEESHEIQEGVQKKIDKMSHDYLIYYKKFTPIVYTKIEDSGVKLTLRYLTEAKKRRTGLDTISRKILSAINAAPDIDFAYPTYRIYKRGEEKKS